MFAHIIDYIKGYISILIEGLFPERFINLCTQNRIDLWNIRQESKNHISANMKINDFKKIRKISKKSGCKVRILQKRGLPFVLYRHRHRKALLIGLVLMFVILWFASQFVWIIEITGTSEIPRNEILDCAKKGGLKTGMLTSEVDSASIQKYIITNMDNVSFVSVNRNGTIIHIDIREREEQRPHFDKNVYSNIISSQDGVIESVLVQSGTALVKKGDIVYKGQLLVSGATDNKSIGIKYTNSDAVIKARVWHEKTVNLPYVIEEKKYTNNEKSTYKFIFFDFSINLSIKNKILFEKYDVLSYTNYITLGDNKILPMGIEKKVYKEYKINNTELTQQQAQDYLIAEMNELYKKSQIVSRDIKINGNKMTAIFECIEDVGREEELNDNREIP